jgi:hypothetical protein
MIACSAFAGQEGIGGNWTEADFKHFLDRLIPYMSSEEGLTLFPEVRAYNQVHPNEPFEKILAELNPRLVDGPVYDKFGNERDCVSGFDTVRFFKCNRNKLPPKLDQNSSEQQKSEYYGSLYRLNLHEAFVQVDLEKPLTKEVASEYALSSRLDVHLENFPEWVPGRSKVIANPIPGDLSHKQNFTLSGESGVEGKKEVEAKPVADTKKATQRKKGAKASQEKTEPKEKFDYILCDYQVRADGSLIMGSLRNDEKQCIKGKLNKPLSLYPGHYLIDYAYTSRALIEIQPGKDLTIRLIPLPAPNASDPAVKFSVFFDYSNNDEFDRIWSLTMLVPNEGFYSTLQPGTWGYVNVKPFFDSGNPATITPDFRNVARTDLGETCMIYDNGTRRNCHLERIADLKPGEFVSVLPGAYGIEWQFTDGHVSYQRDIVVREPKPGF